MKILNEKEMKNINGGEKALPGMPYSTLFWRLISFELQNVDLVRRNEPTRA